MIPGHMSHVARASLPAHVLRMVLPSEQRHTAGMRCDRMYSSARQLHDDN